MVPEHEYDVAILVLVVMWGLPFLTAILYDTYKSMRYHQRQQAMRNHPSYRERDYR